MEALKDDLTELGAPSLEEASPCRKAADLDFMKESHIPDSQAPINHACEVKRLHEFAVARSPHLQGRKNEGDHVAECAAEYRRNVSQMQDLMCSVPHLQDPICKEKLMEACTAEGCRNAADLQGLMHGLNELDLTRHASDFPGLVELAQQHSTEDCGNAWGLQGTGAYDMQIKEDNVKCAAEDCNNLWHLRYLMDHLSEQPVVEEHAAGICKQSPNFQGPGLSMELKGLCGMVNLHKVKLMEEMLLNESHSVSSIMLDLSKMDSAKEGTLKDCGNVSDMPSKLNMVEEYATEYDGPAFDLPSLLSIMGEMLHAEGHPAESIGHTTGVPKNVMDMEHDREPKEELSVILQGFNQLPAYLLAEVVMNMSTVAVFLSQHAPSSADDKRDDVRVHVAPVEANASSSAGNEREDTSHTTASVKANTCLLASTVIPYIKLLGEHYRRSLGSDLRRALHEAKLMEFKGYGPDPAPDWMPCHVSELLSQHGYLGYKEGSFNPLFERIWLPWARKVEFYHDQDVVMICDQEILCRGLHYKTLASLCLSWAIPTRPVLEYMIAKSPQGKIAEIGSGLGYWAALLKKLGADIVAVDDFSEKTIPSALYFPETIVIDGENFIRQGGAHGRALFFCWPLKCWNQKASLGITYRQIYQTCLAEACLEAFHGDTVFFVGEKYDGCTFDMAAWMQKSPKHRRTWRLEREIDIPSWPGVHDVFMCFVRQNEVNKHSSGKKKKKAARKAQQVEDAHLFQLEKSAKEEDFQKASFAAYPNCSMQ